MHVISVDAQTDKHGKCKAILGPAVRAHARAPAGKNIGMVMYKSSVILFLCTSFGCPIPTCPFFFFLNVFCDWNNGLYSDFLIVQIDLPEIECELNIHFCSPCTDLSQCK